MSGSPPKRITTASSPPPRSLSYSRKRKLPTIPVHLMNTPALPQAFSPPPSRRASSGFFAVPTPTLNRAQSVPAGNGTPIAAKRFKQGNVSSPARSASSSPLHPSIRNAAGVEGSKRSSSRSTIPSANSSRPCREQQASSIVREQRASSTGREQHVHASSTGREERVRASSTSRDAQPASTASPSIRSVSCSPPYRWSNSPSTSTSTNHLTCRSRRSQSPPYRPSSSGDGSRSPPYHYRRSPSYSPPYRSSSSSSPAYSSRSSVLSYSADDDLSDMDDIDDDMSDDDSDRDSGKETNESLSKALCEELLLDSDAEESGPPERKIHGREQSSESTSTLEEREKMDEILSSLSSPSSTEMDQSYMDTSWSTCAEEGEGDRSGSDEDDRTSVTELTEMVSTELEGAATANSSSSDPAEVSQGLLDDLFSGADEMPDDLDIADDHLASTSSSLGDRLSLLPHELMANSLSYLDADALCVLCSVCSDITPLAEDWLLWSNLYVKRWPVFKLQTGAVQWKAKFKANDEREVAEEMGDMDTAMRVHMRQAYLSKLVPRQRNEFQIIRRWRQSNPLVEDDPSHTCSSHKCAFYKNDVIYICKETGAVHFCSKLSCKKKRYSLNGDLVCAVTGGIIEKSVDVGVPSEASRRLVSYEDGELEPESECADDPSGMATRFGNSYLARFYEMGYYSEESDLANVWAR